MIVNGIRITSKEHLEEVIAALDEASKYHLRITWAQEINNDKFLLQYEKRAAVKDKIMSEIATENIARVLSGVWTELDLVALTEDTELKAILDDLATLSFEIAFSKIDSISNPLITTDIKNSWKQKLAAHFYPISEL